MKRTWLLALGSIFLQTAVSVAQGPSWPAPAPAILPPPAIIDQEPTLPFSAWMGSSSNAHSEPRIWGGAEALMWWTKNAQVGTPLATAALSSTDPTAGQIGSGNTAVLLGGNESVNQGMRYGGRLTLGGWFDCDCTIGMEANYLYIAPRSTTQTAGSDGSTTIGLPFFNVNTGSQAFAPTSAAAAGAVPATSAGMFLRLSNSLQGGELNGVGRLVRNNNWSIDGLAGFRYLNFAENLDFGSASSNPGNSAAGIASTSSGTLDSFHAANNFYGGQTGLRGEYHLGNFYVQATGKVAVGTMNETMNIAGSSFASNAAAAPAFNFSTNQGGFFAQPTNSGSHTHNAFCVVPEAELKFGYNIARNVQIFAAYNYLYLSDVERPGTAIDHNINPSIVPVLSGTASTPVGVPAPNFGFSRSDFWAQGINVGIEFKF